MRELKTTPAFRRDLKRERRANSDAEDALKAVINSLLREDPLPRKLKDHALKGPWQDYRECHLEFDLLLIYRSDQEAVTLVRLGTHSRLFSG